MNLNQPTEGKRDSDQAVPDMPLFTAPSTESLRAIDKDRRPHANVQPSVLFDEETCNKIDWDSIYPSLADREPVPAIRPSLLFTEEEAAAVDWDAVFKKW